MLTAGLADAVVDLTRQLVAFDSVNPGPVPGAVGEGPIAEFAAVAERNRALWQAAGVSTVVCGPAGGGLHATGEWVAWRGSGATRLLSPLRSAASWKGDLRK